MMIKQIDRLLLTSFVPPFILAFFIALFVLIMQTLWIFVDDIMGKGVGFFMIIELLGYMCITLFPMALPIGILISSVMVFGNLSERYELAAFKSAGVSLIRMMLPIILFTIGIAAFSYFCSNHLIPVANLKFKTRLYDIKRQKPTLSIQEKVFNSDFSGYTMRIGHKLPDGQSIEDILLYDHSNDTRGLLRLLRADHGKMYITNDHKGFVIQLNEGQLYEERSGSKSEQYPFVKMNYKKHERIFDLTQFDLNKTDEDRHKDHHSMLSARQLNVAIDTLQAKIQKTKQLAETTVTPLFTPYDSSLTLRRYGMTPDSILFMNKAIPFLSTFSPKRQVQLLHRVRNPISRNSSNLDRMIIQLKSQRIELNKHIYEYHFKFAAAAICIIFLFIGAPMGAIIRKGGYGYPLLVSIMFFMLYMVLTISFKETMKVGGMDALMAAWLPVLIMLPTGLLLTYMALNDRKLLDFASRMPRIKNAHPPAAMS